jgi:hypothetical protein
VAAAGQQGGGVAVKLVGCRYCTAADDPELPGQLGDVLLLFYLEPESAAGAEPSAEAEPGTGRLQFDENMRLDAQLKVVVLGNADGSKAK